MSTNQEQIARLQGLLDRVQRNAAQPRTHKVRAPAPLVAAPIPRPEPEEELLAMEEPVVAHEPEPVFLPEADTIAAEPPSVEEETSMVRAISEPSADDEEVMVETGEAAIEDLDLDEEEIVDITEAQAEDEEIVPAADEEIEPPASSRRPIAGSMGEALAGAADTVEMDEGREIPLKTPPPESGPQAAPPPQGLASPPVPDIDDLREPELVSGPQPTTAQLGATVELEAASEAELELGEPIAEAPPVHVVREETPPPVEAVQPELVRRPAVAAAAPAGAFVTAARSFHPQSFAELLDASLALGR